MGMVGDVFGVGGCKDDQAVCLVIFKASLPLTYKDRRDSTIIRGGR